jgi:hypothetical protein
MMQFPETHDQPHRFALILQRAAHTDKRQKVIPVASARSSLDDASLRFTCFSNAPETSARNRIGQACPEVVLRIGIISQKAFSPSNQWPTARRLVVVCAELAAARIRGRIGDCDGRRAGN